MTAYVPCAIPGNINRPSLSLCATPAMLPSAARKRRLTPVNGRPNASLTVPWITCVTGDEVDCATTVPICMTYRHRMPTITAKSLFIDVLPLHAPRRGEMTHRRSKPVAHRNVFDRRAVPKHEETRIKPRANQNYFA